MTLVERAVAIAIVAAAMIPAAASAAIVVASSGPSAATFPVGKKLVDAGRITLKAGDSVTVLDGRGTKVMKGPGNFAVSQPGRPLPNPAFAVFTRKDASRSRAGAVRTGEDGKPASPNIWLVDVAKPGTYCIVDPAALLLWRGGDRRKAARYRIVVPGGAFGTVSFAAGAEIAPWDGVKAPVENGASYTLAQEKGSAVGAIKFALMPNPPAEPEKLALALIEKGCIAQLDLLSAELAIARF
jgi:hypothetical protein